MYTNPNRLRQLNVAKMVLADANMPLLALKCRDISTDPEALDGYRHVVIDKDASGGSKLCVFINIGASATDFSQWQFSAYATAVSDPAGVAGVVDGTTVTHTQCTTLGALCKAINELSIGLEAKRLHAPADYSLDTNDFIDAGTAPIPDASWKTCLYKDASEVLTCAVRIGSETEAPWKGGIVELYKIMAYVNSNSGTDCVMTVKRDPNEYSADDEQDVLSEKYVPDATETDMWPKYDGSPICVAQGPILIEVTSTTTLTESTTKVRAEWKNGEAP